MKFEIDKQTLEDLNLLGKYKSNSIFSLFNHTVTRERDDVERMFLNPFTDANLITKEAPFWIYSRKTVLRSSSQERSLM